MMRRVLLLGAVMGVFSGCAIEGVGFDGRVDAYDNAARAGNEYVELHRDARDASWYEGWCAAELPHFKRMDDEYARATRYCDAMIAQPEHASDIRLALVKELNSAAAQADARRDSALAALSAFSAATPVVKPAPVNCYTTQLGNSATTSCY